MSNSRLRFPSLFEIVAASGLCPMPSEIDVLNDSEPCDKGLLDVLQQLETLVTGNVTPATPEFEPSSNFVAMLVIGWLVARENALEILLQQIISPAGTGVAKAQLWLPRDNEQQRALKAYLHWQKEEQHLLWQALLPSPTAIERQTPHTTAHHWEPNTPTTWLSCGVLDWQFASFLLCVTRTQ
ncbi:uncharacterized protein LOC119374567 isoform X3 [Rhipicephalus sanguineus]|uniref:uncharacterized protein LOC119374567 isoform X3 n=1 Tax=Rhipicephalus sanguineus TaxID=34632 RepID=UPI0018944DCB|nr:uncharacterized protein LOC119374567 isoform X3 [Rhipicephalus sanguineus]